MVKPGIEVSNADHFREVAKMVTMEGLVKKVSEVTGVSEADILSRKRTYDICLSRRMIMYIASTWYGKTHSCIACYLRRSRQDISSQLTDFNQELIIYKNIRPELIRIKNELV
jgi:chromosomal replication initiation ATPase DnaA